MKKLTAHNPNGRLPLAANRPLLLLTRFFLDATEKFVHEFARFFTKCFEPFIYPHRVVKLAPIPRLAKLGSVFVLAGLLGNAARLCVSASAADTPEPVDCVDPFIGTTGQGGVYPGVTLPFGFIQVSPDTGVGSEAAGYKFDKNITGFSQQHISGMGGPMFGEISILPLTGALTNPAQLVAAGKSAEAASPGYYTVTLAPWNVKVELTATRHVALHRQTFPASDQAHIVVDVGHCLYGTDASWSSAKPIGGEVNIEAGHQEISGYMVYKGGRATNRNWKVYFVAAFDTAFGSYGTWGDDGALSADSTHRAGNEIGAYLNFKTRAGQVVNSKVAISWRSLEQAHSYLTSEASGWAFEKSRRQARAIWSESLNKIRVEGGTADQRKQFYTAFYRDHITPNDWTGEAPQRYGAKTYYENILCLWDTFRTVYPLLTLVEPKVQAGIVNTLLGYYSVDGWTGDAHSAHDYEHVQNGSSADNIVADAYVKNLAGIDWKLAYQAIRKNAFVDQDPNAAARPFKGRFRLDDYLKYHFLPTDIADYKDVQAVTRTLEYVYNDFGVLTLAKKYGTSEDVADLQDRLLWYQNLWDKDAGGFMRGKTRDGKWHEPFNPTERETGREYYEGHAWTWTWYVPHDPQGLINLFGGDDPFVDKLTTTCDRYYEVDNEPCMLEAYLFIHAGRPDLTEFYVRKALESFSSAPDGLPGNDDSGTTSGWLLWAMLGIYPNAGQDYYYIASPTFTNSMIKLGNGRQFVINAPAASAENKYVASATLNGKPWNQAWLRHADIIKGGTLELEMTAKPSSWGAAIRPPSVSAPAAPATK
jgi:predicted alpha-1,2-mannosidase